MRMFPSFTLANLKSALADPKLDDDTRQHIVDEIAAREAGISKVRVTPQIQRWNSMEQI